MKKEKSSASGKGSKSSSKARSKSRSSSSRKGKSSKSASKSNGKTEDPEEQKKALLQTSRPFAEWDIISDEVKEGLAALGYTHPTPVQSAAIEPGLAGKDLVVQAKTGTGKTSGFGIPLVQLIESGHDEPQALIQAPTRELARQVAQELTQLGKPKGVRVAPLYGGVSIGEQIDQLRDGVDIVVGTPGRLLDHIKRGTLKTNKIKHIALDEADEMLSMGFFLEVTTIMERCSNSTQTMLFSATIPPDIEGLVRQFTHQPARLMVSGDDRRVEGIGHSLYFINEEVPRPRNLLYVLEYEAPTSAIIFCNRKTETALIASYLLRQGKKAVAIHGDMDQRDRERVLNQIKNDEVQYLVATDVASRGIDISGLSHVINYHFPPSTELYIHRVGRTGRQGRQGTAISLANAQDTFQILQLKRIHKIFFDIQNIPEASEVIRVAAERHVDRLFKEALNTFFEPYLPLADALVQDQRGRFVLAHLLKLYHDGDIKDLQEKLDETPTPEPPPPPPESDDSEAQEASSAPQNGEASNDSPNVDSNDGPSMTKLYLKGAGSSDGYDPDKLVDLVVEQAEVSAELLGKVQIERNYAYLNVSADIVEQIIESFQNSQGNGSSITAEIAKKKSRKRRRR